jgi:chloramphenicol-sensitive protein RarD
VPAAEILTHRMIWSCALLMVLTLLGRQWHKVQAVLRQPKVLLTLAFTSITVGGNWLLFIWAINNGHMLDASLGYYINPLFNVLLGMLFLSEKLRRLQWWAVRLAAIGVAIQIIAFGSLPWIALVLASSFAIYGLIRKKLALDALTGLLIETLIMLPPAAIICGALPTAPPAISPRMTGTSTCC